MKSARLSIKRKIISPLSVSAQAYRSFAERKTPIDVAISLDLTQQEATKYYREFWELKKLQCLNQVYQDLRGDLGPFLKL